MTGILLVIAILVFLIVVHELGHFIVAKLAKIRVEEFGIGYPPRAITFAKIGTTEYTLNWIPFGGFVRLFGDVGQGEHGKGSFIDAHRGVQALVLVAGVAMNALAAWMLFAAALHTGIPRVVEEVPEGVPARLVIANVLPGSPAEAAGIAQGDEVLALEDRKGETLSALTPDAFADFIQSRGGQEVSVTYTHQGETVTTSLVPAHAIIPEGGRPALGVAIVLVSSHPLPWTEALADAGGATMNAFASVGSGLWGIFTKALSGGPVLQDVMGPIGLVSVVGDAAETGMGEVFALAAFISVNLAIINILPIPALDGGRLAVLGIEAVMRRQAPKLALQLLNAIGVGLIILLMITVTYQDIGRLIG